MRAHLTPPIAVGPARLNNPFKVLSIRPGAALHLMVSGERGRQVIKILGVEGRVSAFGCGTFSTDDSYAYCYQFLCSCQFVRTGSAGDTADNVWIFSIFSARYADYKTKDKPVYISENNKLVNEGTARCIYYRTALWTRAIQGKSKSTVPRPFQSTA